MSTVFLSSKVFTPVPPEKGSFPLDHEGVCKKLMLEYMICIKENKNNNSMCRSQCKEYMACRMDNSLMAKEDWTYLGLADVPAKTEHQ